MSLPVPLTVRVGDSHVTSEVESLGFRKEAVGGLRSLTFRLSRPIDHADALLTPLAKCYVYDARTATTIAQARISDTGRTADGGGQKWEVVAFGPAQHALDIAGPLIYVDQSLEAWRFLTTSVGGGAQFEAGTRPGVTTPPSFPGLVATWSDGTALPNGALSAVRYDRIAEAGQKVAYFRYGWINGITDPAWKIDSIVSTNGNWVSGYNIPGTHGFIASGTTGQSWSVVTNFNNGQNTIDFRTYWSGAASVVTGDTTWAWIDPIVEAMRLTKAGGDITTGYVGNMPASAVVEDLLGRRLTQFDGANASVATTTTAIDQLAYPDNVTAAQVLEDLMAIEPAYRWTTGPETAAGKYAFRWEAWPTSVRYEATLDDGGSFPLSVQEVYNQVAVRWKDDASVTRTTLRTKACKILDDQGLTRRANIDLGAEVGSLANAQATGDAFLADHNVPKNAGTLNVSRPIRDVITGRMVEPFEIEPGEMIRVRGVESYADSLNASDNDGLSVFRIFAMEYASDDNTARLDLDTDPRDTASALAKLMGQRTRA